MHASESGIRKAASSAGVTDASHHGRLGVYSFNKQRALLNEYRVSVCVFKPGSHVVQTGLILA